MSTLFSDTGKYRGNLHPHCRGRLGKWSMSGLVKIFLIRMKKLCTEVQKNNGISGGRAVGYGSI